MLTCINCGRIAVKRSGDTLLCEKCGHVWTVEDERANAVYLETQGRAPAPSASEYFAAPSAEDILAPVEDENESSDLERLTIPKLRELAAEREIDVPARASKSEIIALISED